MLAARVAAPSALGSSGLLSLPQDRPRNTTNPLGGVTAERTGRFILEILLDL